MQTLPLILTFALFNFLRGQPWGKATSKPFTSLYSGLATGLYCYWTGYEIVDCAVISLITWLGMWLWAADGWIFLAMHGWDATYRSKGRKKWFDAAINWWKPSTMRQRKAYGAAWLSLRGLYILPMFIALGMYLGDWTAIPYGAACGLLMGPVYWLAGLKHTKYSVGLAELGYGAVIGGVMAAVL
jgi:hypothetical protein